MGTESGDSGAVPLTPDSRPPDSESCFLDSVFLYTHSTQDSLYSAMRASWVRNIRPSAFA